MLSKPKLQNEQLLGDSCFIESRKTRVSSKEVRNALKNKIITFLNRLKDISWPEQDSDQWTDEVLPRSDVGVSHWRGVGVDDDSDDDDGEDVDVGTDKDRWERSERCGAR